MPADPARIAIARDLLAQLGVTLADLHDAGTPASTVPTLADYLPSVIAAAGPGANRTYGSYWSRMAAAWGDPPAGPDHGQRHRGHATPDGRDRPVTAQQPPRPARRRTRDRRRPRHLQPGHRRRTSSPPSASPAHRVAKPRRLPNTRRALTADELDQINLAARTSGNDVVLDALLLRLHTETACRRGGALGLRLRRPRRRQRPGPAAARRASTLRWQPISLALAASLSEHAASRGAILPTDSCCATATAAP